MKATELTLEEAFAYYTSPKCSECRKQCPLDMIFGCASGFYIDINDHDAADLIKQFERATGLKYSNTLKVGEVMKALLSRMSEGDITPV